MKSFLLAVFFSAMFLSSAGAQQSNIYCNNSGGGLAAWQPCSPANPLSVTGTLISGQSTGITPTDRTIASATGSSQTVMSANASRHSITIENTGNANCGVNPTGGTAAIGGAGTLTLAPLGAYTPRVPTLSAVTAICTSGQPLYADEN